MATLVAALVAIVQEIANSFDGAEASMKLAAELVKDLFVQSTPI